MHLCAGSLLTLLSPHVTPEARAAGWVREGGGVGRGMDEWEERESCKGKDGVREEMARRGEG